MTTTTRAQKVTARMTPGATARQEQRVADPDADLTTVQVDPAVPGVSVIDHQVSELASTQANTGGLRWTSHMYPLPPDPAHTACYAEDISLKPPAADEYVSLDVEALPDIPAYADRPERKSLGRRADRLLTTLVFLVGLVGVSTFPGTVLAAVLQRVWPHLHWAEVGLTVLAPAIPFIWWGVRHIKRHGK